MVRFHVVSALGFALALVACPSETPQGSNPPWQDGVDASMSSQDGNTANLSDSGSSDARVVLPIGKVAAGAESNLQLLVSPPSAPQCGGVVRSATPATLQGAIEAAKPGDIVSLAAGTYANLAINVASVGSRMCPITIRPAVEGSVTVDACGGDKQSGSSPCFYMNGSYVNLVGMKFGSNTRTGTVELDGDHQRLFGNTWLPGAGDGTAGCCGALVTSQKSAGKEWDSPNPTLLQRFNRIEANTVNQPEAIFYSQGHGVVGTVITHNIINGPVNIPIVGFTETELIKIGGGVANECSNTVIQFNSIYNHIGSPATIELKGSCLTTSYNYIEKGDLLLRFTGKNTVAGNVLNDGTLNVAGTGHTIALNYVRRTTANSAYGPLIMQKNSGRYNFNGNDVPYVWLFEKSSIKDNIFIQNTPNASTAFYIYGDATPVPSGNEWAGNKFIRTCEAKGSGAFTGGGTDPIASGAWKNNNFEYTPASCGSVSVPVVGMNGNTATASAVDVATKQPPMTFDPAFVNTDYFVPAP
jgi:Chondroitinase B